MSNAINISAEISNMPEVKAEFARLERKLERKKINSIQRRNARPILQAMKTGSPSKDLPKMMGITTRQSKRPRAPRVGIRVGVINNDASLFPTFSAPALASVLEYGTNERFRTLKSAGIITGRQSTGEVDAHPWIRPAWDNNVQEFIAKTIKSYDRAVNG